MAENLPSESISLMVKGYTSVKFTDQKCLIPFSNQASLNGKNFLPFKSSPFEKVVIFAVFFPSKVAPLRRESFLQE